MARSLNDFADTAPKSYATIQTAQTEIGRVTAEHEFKTGAWAVVPRSDLRYAVVFIADTRSTEGADELHLVLHGFKHAVFGV